MKKLSKRRKGQLALMYVEEHMSRLSGVEFYGEKSFREVSQIAKAIGEPDLHHLVGTAWIGNFGDDSYFNPKLQRIALKFVKYYIKKERANNPFSESNRRRFGNMIKGYPSVSLDEAMAFVREILHEVVDEVFYPPKSKENSNQG